MATATLKTPYPTLKISLSDQKFGGYVREDTMNDKNPIVKKCADSFFIPTVGMGIRYVKVSRESDGSEKREVLDDNVAIKLINEKKEGYENIIPEPYKIRYIFGCPSIDLEWQDEHNWKPSVDPHSDNLVIEEGYSEVEYSTNPAKYKYLRSTMWFADLPNRFQHIPPMYYEVKENTKAVIDINIELAVIEAQREWEKLVTRTNDGSFNINEEKINGYAQLLNVEGATATEKLRSLLEVAKKTPLLFVEKVKAYGEETITDIVHGQQFGLIKFEGNDAVFTFNGKRISIGKGGNKETKLEKLSEALKTAEYKEQYVLLKGQIQLKKEEALN